MYEVRQRRGRNGSQVDQPPCGFVFCCAAVHPGLLKPSSQGPNHGTAEWRPCALLTNPQARLADSLPFPCVRRLSSGWACSTPSAASCASPSLSVHTSPSASRRAISRALAPPCPQLSCPRLVRGALCDSLRALLSRLSPWAAQVCLAGQVRRRRSLSSPHAPGPVADGSQKSSQPLLPRFA